MIWKYAMPPRVVDFLPRLKWALGPYSREICRLEEIPVLLHVCRESRRVAVSRYGSVFTPNEEGWAWTGSQKSKTLRKIVKALRLRPRKRTIALMSPAISTFLNSPDQARLVSSKFVTCGDNVFEPIWFDPEQDTLLSLPNVRIWGLWNTPQQIYPHNVAFDVFSHHIFIPQLTPLSSNCSRVSSLSHWWLTILVRSSPSHSTIPISYSPDNGHSHWIRKPKITRTYWVLTGLVLLGGCILHAMTLFLSGRFW